MSYPPSSTHRGSANALQFFLFCSAHVDALERHLSAKVMGAGGRHVG